eukprot:6217494-Pyramimonas_sp.AAC.1
MSLGFSAPAFLPIRTSRSTDGPSTASRSAGLMSAACHACARRQATNLAPGWHASHGPPATPGALPLGVRAMGANLLQLGRGLLGTSLPGCWWK